MQGAREDDTLGGGDVLPGFSLSIREWFDRAERTAPRYAGIDDLSPSYHTMREASDTADCDHRGDWRSGRSTDSGSIGLGSNPRSPVVARNMLGHGGAVGRERSARRENWITLSDGIVRGRAQPRMFSA